MRIFARRAAPVAALALIALALSLALPPPPSAHAAPLPVDSLGDTGDATPGDGNCDDGSGNCTLRAAIEEANANGGPDTISFDVAGTINIGSDLPAVTDDDTTIDGTTAPGYLGTPVVTVDGSALGSSSTNGLIRLDSDDNVVTGLRLQNVFVNGLNIQVGDRNQILDNELVDNGSWGLTIFGESDDNLIEGNLISGNDGGGIFMDCNGSEVMTGNTIHDNDIIDNHTQGFTDGAGIEISPVAGTATVFGTVITENNISGNDGHGILLKPRLASTAVNASVIDGNTLANNGEGIALWASSTDDGFVIANEVTDNTLTNSGGIQISGAADTNVSGNTLTGNTVSGSAGPGIEVYVSGSADGDELIVNDNTITDNDGSGITLFASAPAHAHGASIAGNTVTDNGAAGISLVGNVQHATVGPGNVVARNATAMGGTGIAIFGDDALYDTITQNSTYDNADLGIDLGEDGVTANDADDGDTGPNTLLNFPVITSATTSTVEGTACDSCTVEVFVADDDGDNDGHGEGRTFVGDDVADASGNFSVTVTGVRKCDEVTATASDPDGNTSEFSENFSLPCPHPSSKTPTPTPTPEVTATPEAPPPTATMPPPLATATPFGGPAAVGIVPPPTGTGSSGPPSGSGLGLLLAATGAAGLLLVGAAAVVAFSAARPRPRHFPRQD